VLAFCADFPVDCRLVAQAQRQASLLGRVQREVAHTTPLCVLVDLAALQRRPGRLAACLRWLLRLPNLRAVWFADGGRGSRVSEEELGLLLQLVAAHPKAATSLRQLSTWTGTLGQRFDAGGQVCMQCWPCRRKLAPRLKDQLVCCCKLAPCTA